MFDVGFSEIVMIAVLSIIVLGPQEIPKVMFNLGRVMRRLQYIRYAFSQQFEEFLRENGLEDIRDSMNSVNFEARDLDMEDFDESAADQEDIPKIESKADGT